MPSTDLAIYMIHPEDASPENDPVHQEWARMRNNAILSLVDLVKAFDDLDGQGDVFQAAEQFQKLGAAHFEHGDEINDYVEFCNRFNLCLSAGPGCHHDAEDHAAMLRVMKKGLMP